MLRVVPPISEPVLQQIRLLTGLTDVAGETRNIVYKLVLPQCKQVARFCAPFPRVPRPIASSLAFIPLFSFPIKRLPRRTWGAHSYIGPRQVCAAEQDMGYSVLS